MDNPKSTKDTQNNVTTADNCYVAVFSNNGQTGPDSWDTWTETKICNRKTTISEIEDWFFQHCPRERKIFSIEIIKAT